MTERVTGKVSGRNMVSNGIYGMIGKCGRYFVGEAIDKLAEYENAEDEGRLVVLPCNVGDTVYLIDDIDCVFERESIVTEIEIDKDGVTIMIQDEIPICSSGYNLSDFGEIVFLTREEAKKALKEIKKEENKCQII